MPTPRKTAATAPQTDSDTKARQREAYGAATSRVREAHRSEFNTYMVEECAKRGITWAPKPTAEEKARQELDALIEANPGLESVLRERFATSAGDDDSDSRRADDGLDPEGGDADPEG